MDYGRSRGTYKAGFPCICSFPGFQVLFQPGSCLMGLNAPKPIKKQPYLFTQTLCYYQKRQNKIILWETIYGCVCFNKTITFNIFKGPVHTEYKIMS